MNKINFIVILLTFVVSIGIFCYIDTQAGLIGKTVSYGDISILRNTAVLGQILLILVWAILPSWVLAYAYSKMYANVWWVVFVGMTYTIVWMGISFIYIGTYMDYFRDTWHGNEIDFTIHQEHFYLAYILSLIPLVMLSLFNIRKNNETQ